MQSVSCSVASTTCPQSDEECGVNTCQCYGGSQLVCNDNSQVCGGWSFESADPNNPLEGWGLLPGPGSNSVNAMTSVQARSGGDKWLAVSLVPDPNANNEAFFNIVKNVCSPTTNGTTVTGKKVSFVVEVVPAPGPSANGPALVNATEFFNDSTEQPFTPIDTTIASEPYTYQSQPMAAPPSGRYMTQLAIQVQLQYTVPGPVTVYIDNIVLQ